MNAPVVPPKIDFVDLKTQYRALQTQIDARIRSVLEHGQFILGPEVGELEAKLAAYTGAAHCVTCASGTEAILIALMALGIGPGDEVITTPFSFVATAEVIVLAAATPVFVDVERDTGNIDAEKIEAAITPRSKAILPVSLYGQPADMDRINAIAQAHKLVVIEDAAQSFGATYRGRRSCNLSAIACTSFFPAKPLGCYGDGGAIFCGDAAIAQAMREIRVHGQSKRYVHTRIGLVLAKLERFEWELQRRQAVAELYQRLIRERAPSFELTRVRVDRSSAYAQFTVLCENRDAVAQGLKDQGIPTAVHYPVPIHHQPAYAVYARAPQPNAEWLAQRVLSLPMYADLDAATQERIAGALAELV
jgi:UDP-2-acetamido-2-deoxy-ribo-hexuluronate aminotransferase